MPSFYLDTQAQPANWGAGDSDRSASTSHLSRQRSPRSSRSRRSNQRSAPSASSSRHPSRDRAMHGHDRNPDHEAGLDMDGGFVFDVQGDVSLQDNQQDGDAASGSAASVRQPSPRSSTATTATTASAAAATSGLVLPDHVQIIPDQPPGPSDRNGREAKEAQRLEDEEAELGSYDQLDMDPTTAGRYYAADEQEEKQRLAKCPACGEEGHERKRCPHLLCMACGALDSHSTRECPLGTNCFRCGGQGHRSHDCPLPRHSAHQRSRECVKCGSYRHSVATCPTHWRVYVFNDESTYCRERGRKSIKEKEGSRSMCPQSRLGHEAEPEEVSDDGLESYPEEALEEEGEHVGSSWDPATRWCYNCSLTNHWGDNCQRSRVNPTRTNGEPSAFSEFVSRWGPYGALVPEPPASSGPADPSSYSLSYRSYYDNGSGSDSAMFHLSDPATTEFATSRPPASSRGRRDPVRNVLQNSLFDRLGDTVRPRRPRDVSPMPTESHSGKRKGKDKKKASKPSKANKAEKAKKSAEEKAKRKEAKAKRAEAASASGPGAGAGSGRASGKKKRKRPDGPPTPPSGEGGGGGRGGKKVKKKEKGSGKVKVENRSMYRGGYD